MKIKALLGASLIGAALVLAGCNTTPPASACKGTMKRVNIATEGGQITGMVCQPAP